jgi:hypothetical protein
MIRARFTRGGKHAAADGEQTGTLEFEPGELGRVFVAPLISASIVAAVGALVAGVPPAGMIGLVLAAPVTSAIVRITHDLAGARTPALSQQEDSR